MASQAWRSARPLRMRLGVREQHSHRAQSDAFCDMIGVLGRLINRQKPLRRLAMLCAFTQHPWPSIAIDAPIEASLSPWETLDAAVRKEWELRSSMTNMTRSVAAT